MLPKLSSNLRAFAGDEAGLETVEAVLLLAVVILPLAFLVLKVAEAVARYYSWSSYVILQPLF